ncbi:hypothetical protein [Leptospira sp. GIMC2001]|uniref:hypothetical protein n=1 Tax=Leptospira sp. GIMC2001 TaxID=1513297 RepID=UPI00234B53F6|nr:hypothetical protein [Leptospira sp. GIMC2001]WCL49090.1 hypothetical protein O4O04_17640 [Leptospira sp. GIMC2001]
MNKLFLTISLVLALAITSSNCKKEETETTEEMTEETAKSGGGGGNDAKIKAYEDFVTKLCALTDKMKTASATESIQLAKDFANQSSTLKTMTSDLDKLKAETSDAQKSKIDAATKKGTACVASAANTKISAPDIKKEIPKDIPKEIPSKLPGM